MSAPYDPSLLSVVETIDNAAFPTLAMQVYRYADGPYRARLVRLGGKDPRKVDSFGVDELRALEAFAPFAVASLRERSAPPAPTVDPRVAALEAELAALRAKMSAPAAAPVPAPVVPPPADRPAPAPKRAPPAKVAPAPIAVSNPVSAARSALGV